MLNQITKEEDTLENLQNQIENILFTSTSHNIKGRRYSANIKISLYLYMYMYIFVKTPVLT